MGLITNWIGKIVDMKLDQRGMGRSVLDPYVSFDESFSFKENEMQYKGNTVQLVRFYRTNRPADYVNTYLYWREAKGNAPILHFPMARLISQAMALLLFYEMPQIQMTDAKGNPDEASQEVLDDCLGEDENNAINLLKEAAEYVSYSGGVAIVPTLDPDFSDSVIWQCYPRESFHPIFKYKRCVAISTYDEIEPPAGTKDNLVLETTYSREGISYRLLKDTGKNATEVPLTYSPETAGCKPATFVGYPKNFRPFVYVKTKTGRSDYDGAIDSFASIDEEFSAFMDTLRKGHIKTYKPKSMALKGDDGKSHDSGDFDENVSYIPMANPTNAPYKVERDVVAIGDNLTSSIEAWKQSVSMALVLAHISPATIGIDAAGSNASGEALNIREGTSLKTRGELITTWMPALKAFAKLSVALSGAKSVNGVISVANYADLTCSVHFGEYKTPTFDEKVASLSAAIEAGLMDRQTALKELYPGKDDAEIKKMLIAILGGMPVTQDELYKKEDEEDEDKEDGTEDEEKDPKADDESDK